MVFFSKNSKPCRINRQSVQNAAIPSLFWSVFSRIQSKYRKTRTRKTFFAQWEHINWRFQPKKRYSVSRSPTSPKTYWPILKTLLTDKKIFVYPLPPLIFMNINYKQISRIGLKLLMRFLENSTNYWITTVCLCLKIYQTNLLIQYISQAVVLLKTKMIRAKWRQRLCYAQQAKTLIVELCGNSI